MSEIDNTPPLPLSARIGSTLLEFILDKDMLELHGPSGDDVFKVENMSIQDLADICTHYGFRISEVIEMVGEK